MLDKNSEENKAKAEYKAEIEATNAKLKKEEKSNSADNAALEKEKIKDVNTAESSQKSTIQKTKLKNINLKKQDSFN